MGGDPGEVHHPLHHLGAPQQDEAAVGLGEHAVALEDGGQARAVHERDLGQVELDLGGGAGGDALAQLDRGGRVELPPQPQPRGALQGLHLERPGDVGAGHRRSGACIARTVPRRSAPWRVAPARARARRWRGFRTILGVTATDRREGSNTARSRGAQVAGWAIGVVGVAVAVGLGVTDRLDAVEATALACAAVVVSVGGSIALELRARARLRNGWLRRLHQLTDDLARAVESDDPAAGIRQAADRATVDVVAPRAMADERDAFLRSVADLCAQAHERVELDRAQRRARADLELLAVASTRLAASLDVRHVTETIEDLVVPAFADRCELRVLLGSHAPAPARPAEDDGTGTARVELRASEELVGELVLTRAGGIDPVDLATVELLAEPAARALAHALRFAGEAHASWTLQESLLPRAILPVPGLDLATRYLAATEGQAVGGDFYDVVRRPDGTALLMVGDVQGKGIEAAALTSTARHTLRTAALAGDSPAEMLARVNEALLYADAERVTAAGAPTVRFVTASVVALTPRADGGFDGVVASGGHPPPLHIRPDGEIEQLTVEGPLLGVFPDAAFHERRLTLALADVLVLYTDGVTERRHQPELFDERQLGRLVRNQLGARRADAVAQLVLDTVVDLSPRDARDDIALVVARVRGDAAT